MTTHTNVTKEDLINLSKLAEQQKNQGANKIKYRIFKYTHEKELEESFSLITKKTGKNNESTKKLSKTVEKSAVDDDNSQAVALKYSN